MIKASLYTLKCERKKVLKEENIDYIKVSDTNIEFASNCDILNPIILIELTDTLTLNNLLSVNYIQIDSLQRFFFVNNIVIVRTDIIRLDCHVDVLTTFKNEILSNKAFVLRNEYNYNKLVTDDYVPITASNAVENIYVNCDGSFKNTTFKSGALLSNNIVVDVLNDSPQASLGFITTDSTLPNVSSYNTPASYFDQIFVVPTTDQLGNLAKVLVQNSVYASYIKSVVIYPFEIHNRNDDSAHALRIKGDNISSVYVKDLSKRISDYYILADFKINSTDTNFKDIDFTFYEPYSKYELYLPYCGYIDIKLEQIFNKRILVYYICNYEDGTATVNVYNNTDQILIYTGQAQVGIKVGISTTNQYENNIARLTGGIRMGLTTLASVLTIPVNPLGSVYTAYNLTDGVSSLAQIYDRGNVNISEGYASLYTPQSIYIRRVKKQIINYDSDYFKIFGRPLNQVKTLSELNGFTKIGMVHLENIDNAKSDELIEIEDLLKSGIII